MGTGDNLKVATSSLAGGVFMTLLVVGAIYLKRRRTGHHTPDVEAGKDSGVAAKTVSTVAADSNIGAVVPSSTTTVGVATATTAGDVTAAANTTEIEAETNDLPPPPTSDTPEPRMPHLPPLGVPLAEVPLGMVLQIKGNTSLSTPFVFLLKIEIWK